MTFTTLRGERDTTATPPTLTSGVLNGRRLVKAAGGWSMDYLLVFIVAFIVELCATGYTLSVAKGNYDKAILFSVLLTLLNTGVFFFAIDNRVLLAPSALGEILGTVTMLRFGAR